MTPPVFDKILRRVSPRNHKQDTRFRQAVNPGLKLAVTLLHLGRGDEYPTLGYEFRISRKTIANFVPEVCRAIHEELVDEVMQLPQDEAGCRRVEQEVQSRWNVAHALGDRHGKHIRTDKSGRLYHNFKEFFSVILFAVVDAEYKILYNDVGGRRHQSD